jgi:HlyD family secretion protein
MRLAIVGTTVLSQAVLSLSVLSLVALLAGCSEETPRVFGTVERDRLTLTAPVGELVSAVNVSEGQRVIAGQVLLTLDPTTARARVALREAELARARALLTELETGARDEALARGRATLAGATAAVTEARQRFERTEQLLKTQVLTRADLDGARAALDTALARQAEARQSLLELENGTRSEQLAQARAGLDVARAALAVEHKALADLSLSVAQDAVVDILPWRVGDRVAAGTQLIGLLATDKPHVRAYLPATWLNLVSPGSKVQLLLDGRDRPIDGVVRHIRSQPAFTPFYALNERDRARLMYLTEIDIGPEGAVLPTGMALEVELPQ